MAVGWMVGQVVLGIWHSLRRWEVLDTGGKIIGGFGGEDVDTGRSLWSIGK